MSDAPWVQEAARAKINLALHVVGRRTDGYHLLESLVAFPTVGDTLTVAPGRSLDLHIEGPFAGSVPDGPDNLVLRAAEALAIAAGDGQPRGARIDLHKALPAASGIGGGSADAAAALRALSLVWDLNLPLEVLAKIGSSFGADIAMCVWQRSLIARGIGDEITPVGPLPDAGIVLANPGVPVATPDVFQRLERRDNAPLPALPAQFGDLDALIGYLSDTRNDLEPAARSLAPEIDRVLSALETAPGCRFTRMSGSGATCFGLFANEAEAHGAADALRTAFPYWWIEAGSL
ncbi:4-(cytidine 5'-diphospho)-2-C-methyl-D-erythritol kinase [Amorphus orientalis]|uniref:4-diphosphocytidyl-2-C-methyl-D-erythritol kinase n=1 Tax=Amorphus orientalis TaxID=649198 RepID=A0AAE3VPF2_9HYPH|nr:4-(cytidine 5'-diphospho)-2-C-methyl-D-erythritol kinase [Amorphus orientalis]MDQ0315857.1 4-diphosphocytidyl-2-C-methyl-D-erythritol kinase [Amorphus orientalis]